MNWDDLKYFLALLRQGSLSGAARQLRVEHATISRRMDRLEGDLGQRLFDRLPRGWQPTAEGQALADRAEAVEEAFFALSRHGGVSHEGPVRVSAPPLLAAELLTPGLGPFMAENEGIQLSIDARSSRVNLGRGDVDVAVRIGAVEGQTLRVRRLGYAHYRPYGLYPDAGVIRAEPAETEPERWMQAWSGARRLVLNTSDSGVMRAAAEAGQGIALLPSFYAGDLPPVGQEVLVRPVHLTLHEDKARSPRVRSVANAIAAILSRRLRGE